eukprot:symbB.v1.2.029969.t1/scaffold3311.1/size59246/2
MHQAQFGWRHMPLLLQRCHNQCLRAYNLRCLETQIPRQQPSGKKSRFSDNMYEASLDLGTHGVCHSQRCCSCHGKIKTGRTMRANRDESFLPIATSAVLNQMLIRRCGRA